jgi:hypothetical protein
MRIVDFETHGQVIDASLGLFQVLVLVLAIHQDV